jgi:uncharacterized protein (DUF1330 family)
MGPLKEAAMKGYAIGILKQVTMGPPIVEYLERIDATLAPFGGQFIVHGGDRDVLEGSDPGTVIILEFPDRAAARAWYQSAEYQAIVALRTENSDSIVVIVEGVDADHKATDVLSPT